MIINLLIVDCNLEETTRNLLNTLINKETHIYFHDFKSTSLLIELKNYLKQNDLTNIVNVGFFNLTINKSNLFTYNYNNELSILYDIEHNKSNFLSWKFIEYLINDLNSLHNLESLNFIDINHLVYYDEYSKILKYIEDNTSLNVNYLSKSDNLSEENYDKLFENKNLLYLLFNDLCIVSENIQNIVEIYFNNNSILLNSLIEVEINEFNVKNEELIVFANESHTYLPDNEELNIFIIPLKHHVNNLTVLKEILEEASYTKHTLFEFIYPIDTVATFFNRLKGKIFRFCGENIKNVNIVNKTIWLKPKMYNNYATLINISNNIVINLNNLVDNNLKFFINGIKHAIETVKKDTITKINFEIMNIGKNFNSSYKKAIDYLYDNKNINSDKIVCKYSYTIPKYPHTIIKSIYEKSDISLNDQDEVSDQLNLSYDISKNLLNVREYYGNEYKYNIINNYHNFEKYLYNLNKYGDFIDTNIIKNVVLFDTSLRKYLKYIENCLLPNTIIIKFDKNKHTYDDIKQNILKISENDNVEIKNVAIMQHNIVGYTYNILQEETSIVNNVKKEDSELNTWTKFKDFVSFLQNEISVENLDLLMCNIYSDDNWKYVLDKINEETPNIKIRSSEDVTGHVLFDGDWILESPEKDVDLIGLYFTKNIKDVKIGLNTLLDSIPFNEYILNGETYRSYAITTVGTTNINFNQDITNLEFMIVGGGEGGWGYWGSQGGVAGAMIVTKNPFTATAGTYVTTVGAGGAGSAGYDSAVTQGSAGEDSVFYGYTALGGGNYESETRTRTGSNLDFSHKQSTGISSGGSLYKRMTMYNGDTVVSEYVNNAGASIGSGGGGGGGAAAGNLTWGAGSGSGNVQKYGRGNENQTGGMGVNHADGQGAGSGGSGRSNNFRTGENIIYAAGGGAGARYSHDERMLAGVGGNLGVGGNGSVGLHPTLPYFNFEGYYANRSEYNSTTKYVSYTNNGRTIYRTFSQTVTNGTVNTGSGGGGGGHQTALDGGIGGDGGSGIIVFRYKPSENSGLVIGTEVDIQFLCSSIVNGNTENRISSFEINLKNNISFSESDLVYNNGSLMNFTKVNDFKYTFDFMNELPNITATISIDPSNTTLNELMYFPKTWTWNYTYPINGIKSAITGNEITNYTTYTDNNVEYRSFAFTNVGVHNITLDSEIIELEFIIVAGGGGGSGGRAGQGGGGGGVIITTKPLSVPSGNYTIKVGSGGQGGSEDTNNLPYTGENSEAFGYIAIGGGAGTAKAVESGGTGASGINQANGGSGGGNDHKDYDYYGKAIGYNGTIIPGAFAPVFTKLAGAGGLTGSGGTNGTYGGSNRHKNNGTYDFSNLWDGTLTDINDTWGSYNSAGTVSNTPTTSYYLYFTFPTATAVNQYNIWKRPQYNNGDTWSTHAPGTWELRGTNDIASYDRSDDTTYTTLDSRTVTKTEWDTVTLPNTTTTSTNYTSRLTSLTDCLKFTFTNTTEYLTYILDVSSNAGVSADGDSEYEHSIGQIALLDRTVPDSSSFQVPDPIIPPQYPKFINSLGNEMDYNDYVENSVKYRSYTFTDVGTNTVTLDYDISCDFMIVAGGGAGSANVIGSGGGGGGVVIGTNQRFTSGTYNIHVGDGGTGWATVGGRRTDEQVTTLFQNPWQSYLKTSYYNNLQTDDWGDLFGTDGENSYIQNNSNVNFVALGGGGGKHRFTSGGGSSSGSYYGTTLDWPNTTIYNSEPPLTRSHYALGHHNTDGQFIIMDGSANYNNDSSTYPNVKVYGNIGGAGGGGDITALTIREPYARYVKFETTGDISYPRTGVGLQFFEVGVEPVGSVDIFNSSGTLELTSDSVVDILIVGGGGAGGAGHQNGGGGGGGGVVYAVNQTLTAGTYNIVIGNGGTAQQSSTFSGWPAGQPATNGENGEDSYIYQNDVNTPITLDLGGVSTSAIGYGGGAGGSHLNNGEGDIRAGEAGGSGGGSGGKFGGKSDFPATRDNFIGGASTQGNTIYDPSTQTYISGGNAGNGTSGFPNGVSHPQVGGGGGGAGGTLDNTSPGGLNGQDGVSITINGVTYAVGGGGGGSQLAYNDSNHGSSNSNIQSSYSNGGLGGGGDGLIFYTTANAIGGNDGATVNQHPKSGTSNTGGGGGGFNNLALISSAYTSANETTKPGDGGSGIVIINVHPPTGITSIPITNPIISQPPPGVPELSDITELQMEYIASITATSSTWTSTYTNNSGNATTSGTSVPTQWTLGNDADGDFYLMKNNRVISPSYPNMITYLSQIDTTNSNYAGGVTYEAWVKLPSNLSFGSTSAQRGWLMGVETGWGPFLCINDFRFGGIGMSPGATDNNSYSGLTSPGYISNINYSNQLLHIVGYLYRSPTSSQGFKRGVWINGTHYPQETTQQSGNTDYPSLDTFNNPFNIGNHSDNNTGHHASNLNIYSFRVWHRQLTESQVGELYARGPNETVFGGATTTQETSSSSNSAESDVYLDPSGVYSIHYISPKFIDSETSVDLSFTQTLVSAPDEPKLLDSNGNELPFNTYTENSIEYKSYVFTDIGTTSVSLSHDVSCDFMIVAGGGGGGNGAAGGGGVVVGTEYMLGSGNYDITVGNGGHSGPLSDAEITEVYYGDNTLINSPPTGSTANYLGHVAVGGNWYESVVRGSGMNGEDSSIEGGTVSFKALKGAGGTSVYIRNSGGSSSGSLYSVVTINSEYPRGYDDNGDLFDIIGGQANYGDDAVKYPNVNIYGNQGGIGLNGLGWTNAGGGGAGSAGGSATGTTPTSTHKDSVGGKGGDGLANTFVDGTTQYYGAGGPGSVHDPMGTDGVPGLGGVAVGVSAPANTGAGASSNGDGGTGNGGSGIVVIRFPGGNSLKKNKYEFTESKSVVLNLDISAAEFTKITSSDYPSPLVSVYMGDDGEVVFGGTGDYVGMVGDPEYTNTGHDAGHTASYRGTSQSPTLVTAGPNGYSAMNFNNNQRLFLTKTVGQGGIPFTNNWTYDCYIKPSTTPSNVSHTLAYAFITHTYWLGYYTNDGFGVNNGMNGSPQRGNWSTTTSNYMLGTDAVWKRLTVVSDGENTKTTTYIDGVEVGSQPYAWTSDGAEFFILGNYDYNYHGWGNLYGFRFYDSPYLPSELEDPVEAHTKSINPMTPYNWSSVISLADGGTLYTYNSNGTFTLSENSTVDIIIVGGGGAGGHTIGGGGGAGGVVYTVNQTMSAGTYNIVVGAGGQGKLYSDGYSVAENGEDSYIYQGYDTYNDARYVKFETTGTITSPRTGVGLQFFQVDADVSGTITPITNATIHSSADLNAVVPASNLLIDYGSDGTTSANSSGNTYWAGTNGQNAYFVMDLGQVYSISQYRMKNTNNGTYGDRWSEDFKISISTDGVNFNDRISDTLQKNISVTQTFKSQIPAISMNMGGVSQELKGLGGGGGSVTSWSLHPTGAGNSGGSGGGAGGAPFDAGNGTYYETPPPGGTSTQGNTFYDVSTQTYIKGGSDGSTYPRKGTGSLTRWNNGGGGGGMGLSPNNGTIYSGFNGSNGAYIDINGGIFVAAGGGGCQYSYHTSVHNTSNVNYGKGGSNIGGSGVVYNASNGQNISYGVDAGSQFYLRGVPTSGVNGTGSGGGGWAYQQKYNDGSGLAYHPAGSGGSGIVIIKVHSTTNNNLLLTTDIPAGNYDINISAANTSGISLNNNTITSNINFNLNYFSYDVPITTQLASSTDLSNVLVDYSSDRQINNNYLVTVNTKTANHPYYGSGSSSGYYMDGVESPPLYLALDNTYRFNQEDGTNSGHPLLFYEDVDRTVQYTTGVTINGTPGTSGAYTEITVTSSTPTTLYYQCQNHGNMGGIIYISSSYIAPGGFTYWITDNVNSFFILDLGASYLIKEFKIKNTNSGTYGDKWTENFIVSISTDGAEYSQKINATLQKDPSIIQTYHTDNIHRYTITAGTNNASGGGGGAGGIGESSSGTDSESGRIAGHGGIGIQNNFVDGTLQYYAGGGAGGVLGTDIGTGGAGGGGNSLQFGTENTGGGGGSYANNGSGQGIGGDGGSGIVTIRYPLDDHFISFGTRFKYVVLYRAQPVSDFSSLDSLIYSIAVREMMCVMNDGTDILLSSNGTSAIFSTDFTHDGSVASTWSENNTVHYAVDSDIRDASKIIDGANSGNGGNAFSSTSPIHFIASLPSEYHIVDINQIEFYSSRTGNSMWRNAGLQVLLLDASLNIKISTSVTSTAESVYTFNINNPTFRITGGSASYKNDPSIFQNIIVYGNDGGASQGNAWNGTAAGGGGAGEVGGTGNNSTGVNAYISGDGGDGIVNNFLTGSDNYYAGGGGAGNLHESTGNFPKPTASGGIGGGGAGGSNSGSGFANDGISGTSNTGGGGGGSSSQNTVTTLVGGDGGSGIVGVRYKIIPNTVFELPSALTFSGPTLDGNNNSTLGIVDIELVNTDVNLPNITQNNITITNGTILNFTKESNTKYIISVSAHTPGVDVTLIVPNNVIYNTSTGTNNNEPSNVFSWTWNYSVVEPDVVLHSIDLSDNASSSIPTTEMELNIINDVLHNNTVETELTEDNITVTNGYVYNVRKISNTRMRFNIQSTSTAGLATSIKLNRNVLFRRFNNIYNINSNKESNIFHWTYASANLVINTFQGSGNLSHNGYVNNRVQWFRIVFSEDVYNFNKDYITGTNCSVDKIVASSNRSYAIKCTTYVPTSASITIANNLTITTGVGLAKTISGNNLTFNWNYDNRVPNITFTTSHKNNSTNNNNYLDISINSSQNINNFLQSSIIITGNASVTSFSGSGSSYSVRITPTLTSTITVTLDNNLTDIYGNSFSSMPQFNWNYDNTNPTIFVTSGDLDDGQSSSDDFITVNFITNKEIFNFNLSDDSYITNGTLSNLQKVTNVSVQNDFNVSVSAKTTDHPYHGSGSSYGYYIDGDESPSLNLIIGESYYFYQSDSTNNNHPLKFYTDVNRTTLYESGVTYNGTPGVSGAYTLINIQNSTPSILYYQCGNHANMGNYISIAHNDKYQAILKPTVNNSRITLYILENSFEDHVGNVNTSSSNVFEWDFSGDNLLSILNSTDVSNNGSISSQSIDMKVEFTNDIVTFELDDISFTNGSISNIASVDNKTKTFTFTSINYNVLSTIFIPEASVTTGAVDNKESNIFSWTYSIVIPSLTINSSLVDNGSITNNNNIPFTFTLNDSNITLLESNITVTNANISNFANSSSGVYSCNIIPTITQGQISIIIPEDEIAYNQNGVDYKNDLSFNYDISYDGVEPSLTLTSNIVDQDLSTNTQEVFMVLTSTENINNLEAGDINITNGVAHSLSSSSGSQFTFYVKATDNTIDNNIKVYIEANSVVDDVGNSNSVASNEYDFIINAKVSKKKTTTELVNIFSGDTDISAEDIPSESEINLVVSTAFTIPDTSNPFAEETTQEESDEEEVVTIPKIVIPPQVKITNRKVFSALIDQIFEAAEDIVSIKIDKTSMALTEAAVEKLADVEEVVMAKSNQTTPIDFSSVQEDPTQASAVFIPLTAAGDFVRLSILSDEYLITSNGDDTFNLTKNSITDLGIFNSGTVYEIPNSQPSKSLVFGSVTATSEASSSSDASSNDASSDDTSSPSFGGGSNVAIPCFLEGTEILTTHGYKTIQELEIEKDTLIDHLGNELVIREIKKFVKNNNGKEYPHKIPEGSKLSEDFIVTKDLYITYNHCIYLPHVNKYVPVSVMKNIKPEISDVESFTYYHIYTDNYFSDTIIANGIPCESHSKYTFNYISNLDNTGKLLKNIFKEINMKPNCERERITHKAFKNIIKKNKKNTKKGKKVKKCKK